MAGDQTIARPYAKGAFDYALKHNAIRAWHDFLQLAATIITDKKVNRLLNDPRISQADVLQFLINTLEDHSDKAQQNFIKLLSQYHRLNQLPAITMMFEQMRKAHEKSISVTITSAFKLDEKMQEKLIKALEIRLQKAVKLDYEIDESILGGAIIKAGDFVIDGSVRAQIDRMRDVLQQ